MLSTRGQRTQIPKAQEVAQIGVAGVLEADAEEISVLLEESRSLLLPSWQIKIMIRERPMHRAQSQQLAALFQADNSVAD